MYPGCRYVLIAGCIFLISLENSGAISAAGEDAALDTGPTAMMGSGEDGGAGAPCLKPKAEKYLEKILPLEELYPGKYQDFSIKDAWIKLDHVLLSRVAAPALTIDLVHPLANFSVGPTFKTKNFVGILASAGREQETLEVFKKIGAFIAERDNTLIWDYCEGPTAGMIVMDYASRYYLYACAVCLLLMTLLLIRRFKRKNKIA